jgi:hypothetical protein
MPGVERVPVETGQSNAAGEQAMLTNANGPLTEMSIDGQ